MATGIACLIGVVALWSFVPVLIKQLLPVFDPLTIAFLRLAQGAAQDANTSTPMGAAAEAMFALFCNSSDDSRDFSAIINMIRGN